jgi:hypothetical protein
MQKETNTAIDVAGMHQEDLGSRSVDLLTLRQRDEDYQLHLRAGGHQENPGTPASVF